MDYAESLKWYDALSRSGIKPGLERVGELLEKLGNPHKKLKYVHVAGTNGKGSFCSVMSGILSCAGYKTGLFTSPFVFGFEEQLQIDGKYISENALARLFTCVEEKCAGMSEQPTAFEALTAAAFLYFYEQKCDFAVVECGMGGKNDCTNIIPSPEVAALMSVSKDHTAYLGDTVEKIAQEKCGIIKNGCYAVCYPENGDFPQPPQVVGVFKHSCEKANARYSMANLNNITVLEENLTSSLVGTPYGKITIPFAGRHQLANFATVLEAVKALRERGYIISDADIKNGTQKAYMPARLEKLSDKPLVILDGGHNPGCADAVNGFFANSLSDKRTVILGAIMKDKDFEGTFGSLLSRCEQAIFTRAPLERCENPEILCRCAEEYGVKASCFEDCDTALKYALSVTDENGLLFICGSFYLAREIRNKFSSV